MKTQFRTLVFSVLELTSPLHLGGAQDSPFTDLPVSRDSGGRPFIPGGTLAGAWAAGLSAKKRRDWLGIPLAGEKDTAPSRLVMDDAYPVPEQIAALAWPVEIRDHVTVNRQSMGPQPKQLYSAEYLPVGTRFAFFCRVDLADDDDRREFLAALEGFLARGGQLGGKRNAGAGQWRAEKWAHLTWDLTKPADLFRWLESGHGLTWSGDWMGLEGLGATIAVLDPPETPTPWTLELRVEIDGLHLSAAGGGMPVRGAPDLRQSRRQRFASSALESEPVDYGTAVKGRIRSMMEMLLRTYLIQAGSQRSEVEKLVPANPTDKSSADCLAEFFGSHKWKGRWSVRETPWREARDFIQDHIHLDEFTQTVMDGAKFSFAPLRSGCSKVVISLPARAESWQKALIYRACQMLTLNILPWSGHGARGYLGARLSIEGQARLAAEIDDRALPEFVNGIITQDRASAFVGEAK